MNRIDPETVTATATELLHLHEPSNGPVDCNAWRAKDLLLSGQIDDAAEIVMPILLTGTASPAMQKIAVALYYYATGKPDRGPRPKPRPQNWYKIGDLYDELREQDLTYEDTIQRIVKKFNMSRSSVETSRRFYKAVAEKFEELSKP